MKKFLMALTTALLLSVSLIGVSPVMAASPPAVDLGVAADFTLLSKSGISNATSSMVDGNIGVSPITSTAITGFSLVMDSSGMYATSALVTGRVYASDYATPTPTYLSTAIDDMQTAYNNAANGTLYPPNATELGAGNITGMTLVPGVYKWSTGVLINSPGVTLSGSGVWIFQIAGNLTLGSGATINGGDADSAFWQVGGGTGAKLGTHSSFNGTILSAAQVIMDGDVSFNGRALALSQVTLDGVANSVNGVGAGELGYPPIPITVTADPQTKYFMQADPTFTYTVTSGSLLPGDSFSGSLTREFGELPGRYDILQGSLTAGDNYVITYRKDSLTILLHNSPPPPTGTNPPGTLTPTTTPITTATTVLPTVPPTTSAAPGTTVITMTNPGPAPTTGPTPSQEYVILPGGTSLPPTSSDGTVGIVMTWWLWVLIAAGCLLLLALILAATRRREDEK